jgi:hypothetical protein
MKTIKPGDNRIMTPKSKLYHPTAYHEAGHAVTAYFLGVRLKKVTIIPNKDYVGAVIHEKVIRGISPEIDTSLRNFARMERLARIALAGSIAQKIHAPRSHDGASSDRQTVADVAFRFNGSSEAATAWIKWLKIGVTDTLNFRWTFVDAVAHELVKQKELTREQIAAIFKV